MPRHKTNGPIRPPRINAVYEKQGEYRYVIEVRQEPQANHPDVIFFALNRGKERSMWLPFWHEWEKEAKLVSIEPIPADVSMPEHMVSF